MNIESRVDKKAHPWACTVLRWWHWRWRCASPRHSVKWRRRPMVASRGASVAATARWQSTRAGLVHCSRQKTWKQQQRTAGQLVKTLLLTDHHGITWTGLKWITIMNLSDRSRQWSFSLSLPHPSVGHTVKSCSHTKDNIPVLPAGDKVGVFHQVAVNVFHMVTGTTCEETQWRQRKTC